MSDKATIHPDKHDEKARQLMWDYLPSDGNMHLRNAMGPAIATALRAAASVAAGHVRLPDGSEIEMENGPLPITKDGKLVLGGKHVYSIESKSDPFGPKDNIVSRALCGTNYHGEPLAHYDGTGGRAIESFRCVRDCYSTREAAAAAKGAERD